MSSREKMRWHMQTLDGDFPVIQLGLCRRVPKLIDFTRRCLSTSGSTRDTAKRRSLMKPSVHGITPNTTESVQWQYRRMTGGIPHSLLQVHGSVQTRPIIVTDHVFSHLLSYYKSLALTTARETPMVRPGTHKTCYALRN